VRRDSPFRAASSFRLRSRLGRHGFALGEGRESSRSLTNIDEVANGHAENLGEGEQRLQCWVSFSALKLREDAQRQRLLRDLLLRHAGSPACTPHVCADSTGEGAELHLAT
jgi:hypothetical protein